MSKKTQKTENKKEKKVKKVKPEVAEQPEGKKHQGRVADSRKFLVVYGGLAGKKAEILDEAKVIGDGYVKDGKCKKYDVYKLVESVTPNQ